MAGANDAGLPQSSPSFAQKVSALLERTEYRRCDKGEDLEDIYQLRYKSYRMSDLVPENASRLVADQFDDLPNCHRFGVYIDGHLAGTIRLHAVSAEHPTSPAMSVYGDILQPRLDEGGRFIDPSRFAADPDWSRIHPQLPYVTMRLPIMACYYFDAPYCISMIRDDHVAFYKRVFQATAIGEERPYGGVINTSALLYQIDVQAVEAPVSARFPFFLSTAREQRMLFAGPALGENAPLTILPTAKYLQAA
jgi:hypothetical protein